MRETTKNAMADLKEIPGEIRERVQDGTERFLDQVRAPFEEALEDETSPIHVVPRNGSWAILPQGSGEATDVCETKEEAFEQARDTAREQNTTLIVHRQDGTVQETRSYRED